MQLSKILPKKFSSRLFLMTLAAGLIPVVIFTLLLEIYGGRFRQEIQQAIRQAYEEQWTQSEAVLKESVGTLIEQRATDVAQELELTMESHPYMTLKDLQRDNAFRVIAVQPVGRTGYTSLHESGTGIIRFHRMAAIENMSPGNLRRDFPSMWSIIEKSLGGVSAQGFYQWQEPDGAVKPKYMYIAPLHVKTADGVLLSVAVTASVDEFTQPIRDTQAVHSKTAEYLSMAAERLLSSFRHMGLFYMGLGILIIAFVAYGVGIYFSRAIRQLREATNKVNSGDLNVTLTPSMSGEVKTLMEDFNRMIRQLAETTVSKELLEESERRLIDANYELQHEVNVRTLAEKALATEKERLAITLGSIADGVITTDADGKVIFLNRTAEGLTGWSQIEAFARSFTDVFHAVEERTRTEVEDPLRSVVETGEPMNAEKVEILVSRDGSEKIVTLNGVPIREKDSTVMGVVVVFRDITEKRKMEEELLTVRKLESVGTLAGGIAHDFNNLLAVILGNISFAKMLVDPASKVHRRLTEAEEATLRGKDLTYRLLTFSRGGEPLKRVMGLKNIIKDSTRLTLSGSNVKASFVFPDNLYRAEIDEGQMRQVIHNVVINAKEAMPEGGKIIIKAKNITLTAQDMVPLADGDYVKISIEDQGTGVPAEDLARIFDPYFTTKDMGNTKGMGLGLAICYSIIKNHNGFISAESQVGVGTTIQIYLPAYREALKADETEELPDDSLQFRILYMDDEEALRGIAREMLEHLGFHVTCVSDGAEAFEAYSAAMQSRNPFDLVIMDLTIPDGMGGKEAIEKLREIDPGVKAIVSSGYANDPIIKNFKEYGFLGVIAKPYDVEALDSVIKNVMTEGT
ncbi:MAG TPA: ATP-binding protein [Syntrophorhabdaceae bacterium]|nr:ATP-binding protein [Syntrophorhabdaceae bacterium]